MPKRISTICLNCWAVLSHVCNCYSFELVNTSSQAIFDGDVGTQILIVANLFGVQNRLNYPVIGYYTRDDVISFNFGFVSGSCYVRADVKINDQEDPSE